MMKKLFLAALAATWAATVPLTAEGPVTLEVKHGHWLGSCGGHLIVDGQGIRYDPEEHAKHLRRWEYAEIQQVRIDSPTQLEILTYEDSNWKLGRDRRFHFRLVEGRVTPELVQLLRDRLSAPVVSAVFAEPRDVFSTIPAKHRHALGGGCQGQLLFGEKGIYYASSNQRHSRFWPVEAIESLGRRSDFSLRITVRERNRLGESRNFQFQLKRPMDSRLYQRLWRKVYEPESWLNRLQQHGDAPP